MEVYLDKNIHFLLYGNAGKNAQNHDLNVFSLLKFFFTFFFKFNADNIQFSLV